MSSHDLISIIISQEVIAALIGVIGIAVTAYITYKSTINNIINNNDHKIFDIRMKYYPQLFKIIQDVGKSYKGNSDVNLIEYHREARRQLCEWENTSGFLVCDEDLYNEIKALKDALKSNPGNGTSYTQEQLKKIFKIRNSIRGLCFDDIKPIIGKKSRP